MSLYLNSPGDEEDREAVSLRANAQDLTGREIFQSEQFAVSPGSRVIEAFRRHKLIAVVVFLLVAGVTGGYIGHLPPRYQSEMTIFMARSRADAPVSAGNQAVGASAKELDDTEVNSELELLRSATLLKAAAQKTGLLGTKDPNSVEGASLLKAMEANLQVSILRKSRIISLTYVDSDPSRAQAVVSAIGDLYLEKHASIQRNPAAAAFFAEKAKVYAAELASVRRELAAYEQNLNLSALDARIAQNLTRRSELQTQLDDTNSQLNEAQEKAKVLRSQLGALPSTVNAQNRTARNEPLIEKLKTMELELSQKRTELLSTFAPNYPPVVAVEQKIRDTRAALERELTPSVVDSVSSLNLPRQQVQSELLQTESTVAALRARQANIVANLQREDSTSKVLVASAPHYEDLKRQAKVAEDNYLLYTRKQEDSQISEEMDQQRILNVSILQPASRPVLPMDRHRTMIALMGLLAAILMSVTATLFTEGLDKPVWTQRDVVRAAGIPVIASIQGNDACF